LEALYDAIQTSLDEPQRQTASKLYQLLFEWKRVWNSRIAATYIWLGASFQGTESLAYPSKDEEPRILPVLARLLVETTKGLLQLSSPSSSKPQVELLHRTLYDWMRMGENWSTITENQPRGFDPTLSLIAALVCRFQSGRLDIMNGKLEAALYRIFCFTTLKSTPPMLIVTRLFATLDQSRLAPAQLRLISAH